MKCLATSAAPTGLSGTTKSVSTPARCRETKIKAMPRSSNSLYRPTHSGASPGVTISPSTPISSRPSMICFSRWKSYSVLAVSTWKPTRWALLWIWWARLLKKGLAMWVRTRPIGRGPPPWRTAAGLIKAGFVESAIRTPSRFSSVRTFWAVARDVPSRRANWRTVMNRSRPLPCCPDSISDLICDLIFSALDIVPMAR